MLLTKKGFSMIELMVVVGIIAIISLIAIPNFQRYAAKARQANAKNELAAIYGMEQNFKTEHSTYTDSLVLMGFSPDGVPLDSAGCPDISTKAAAQWQQRHYSTGFPGTGGYPKVDAGANVKTPTCDGSNVQTYIVANIPGSVLKLIEEPNGTEIGDKKYIVGASGRISGGDRIDRWTINEVKQLINSRVGF